MLRLVDSSDGETEDADLNKSAHDYPTMRDLSDARILSLVLNEELNPSLGIAQLLLEYYGDSIPVMMAAIPDPLPCVTTESGFVVTVPEQKLWLGDDLKLCRLAAARELIRRSSVDPNKDLWESEPLA